MNVSRRTGLPVVLLSALAVTLSGCGSTVKPGSAQAAGGATQDGLQLQQGATTPTGTAPIGGGPTTTTGSSTPSGSPVGVVSGQGTSSPGGISNGTPQGVMSRKPIEVGIFVQVDSSALANSVGASNLKNGNERDFAKALIDDLNLHGGITGRLLSPVYYVFDPSKQSSATVAQQEACATFTQDHHVVAALLGWHGFSDHVLDNCLAKHGVITINSAGIQTGDKADLANLPYYFAPPGLTLDRQAVNYIEALSSEGFFTSGSKIGLVTIDQPPYHRAVDGALKSTLKNHGLALTDKVFYPPILTTADAGSQSAAIANAVLKFKTEGISRVIFLQLGINGPLFFMRSADAQNYLPRYGLSTTDAPDALTPLVPARQLHGTTGMGWAAVYDVPAKKEDRSAPNRKACLALIQKRTGETFSSRNVEYVGLTFCDSVWFFSHVASALTSELTASSFASAVPQVGGTYRSPLVLATTFGTSVHDGAASARNLQFDDNCSCFSYTGSSHALS